MLSDLGFFRPEGNVSDAPVQMHSSPEFVHTCDTQLHEIIDAIAAAVAFAQAGSNWLRAQPPDLEEVRQALNSISEAGKRASEIVVRLRALTDEGARGGFAGKGAPEELAV